MLQIQPQISRTRYLTPKILILISLPLLIGYALATTYWSVTIQNRGTIHYPSMAYMEPPEVIFDFGTMEPGQRRDIFHQLVAELTVIEKLSITASLDVDSAIYFNIIGIWIQLENIETGSPRDYFLSQTTPSETRTIYSAVYRVYYDGTFFARDDVTEPVSGEMITTVSYNGITIGTFIIKYVIIP